MLFNRNELIFGRSIEQPSQELVKNTLALWNCSVEDALKYGGDLTRAAIGAMNLRGDRKYIVIDTKVHMLKKGFCPAIPGWHTDGAPRDLAFNPNGSGPPNIAAQDETNRPPRFHLLVTGMGCMTEFLADRGVEMTPPSVRPYDAYSYMTSVVNKLMPNKTVLKATSCQVHEFDWWDIHQGTIAEFSEWRFLIRACETDFQAPQTDLRDIIRTQQNVYVPSEFGW